MRISNSQIEQIKEILQGKVREPEKTLFIACEGTILPKELANKLIEREKKRVGNEIYHSLPFLIIPVNNTPPEKPEEIQPKETK